MKKWEERLFKGVCMFLIVQAIILYCFVFYLIAKKVMGAP